MFKTTKFKFLFCEDEDILMILDKKSFQLLKGLNIQRTKIYSFINFLLINSPDLETAVMM